MELTTLSTILVAVAPAISAVLTILVAALKVCSTIKKIKKESDNKLLESNARLEKAYDNIAIMQSKLASIEKYLVQKEDKKKKEKKELYFIPLLLDYLLLQTLYI